MKRDIHLAVLLLLIICLTLAIMTGLELSSSRQRTLEQANTQNLNLTKALDTYVESVFTQNSILLAGLAKNLEKEGISPEQLQKTRELVKNQQSLLSQLAEVILYDAQGNWLMSSSNLPVWTKADEDFTYHRTHNDALYISRPIYNPYDKAWRIGVSRSFKLPNNSFGVISAQLDITKLLKLFGKIDVGNTGSILLLSTNGQLLMRYPFKESYLAQVLSDWPVFLHLQSVGTSTFYSSLDGTERLYAFQRNGLYPLMTLVAQGKEEVLEGWKKETLHTLIASTSLLVVICIIGFVLIASIRKRILAEKLLWDAREELLRANQQLEVLASYDALTGLANRRSLDERLTSELRRALREGVPLGLLMIDIDYFKRFNDSYGHQAGDECLRTLGQLLLSCLLRPGDFAARYGGEELTVILPNADSDGAQAVAERFLQRLAEKNLPHQASPFAQVTVSIGIACMAAGQPVSAAELVKIADDALYRAKASGRNRLENASAQYC